MKPARNPREVKMFCKQTADMYGRAVFDNEPMKGAMIGTLNRMAGSDDARKEVIKFLFGVSSSKKLSGAQWIALARWIDMVNVDDKWIPQECLKKEVDDILEFISKGEIYVFG